MSRRKYIFFVIIGMFMFIVSCLLILVCYKKSQRTLYWATPYVISEHTTDLLNHELQEKGYDVEIKFQYIDPSEYYDQVNSDIDRKQIDILFSGVVSWQSVGRRNLWNDKLLPLDDFFRSNEGKRLYDAIPQTLWEAMKVEGQSYFICSGGNIPNRQAVIVNRELANKYNVNIQELDYRNICDYINVMENSDSDKYLQYPSCLLKKLPEYTFVCSPFVPLVIYENGDTLTVENLLDIPEYVALYENMQNLNDANLIASGSSENTDHILFRLIYLGIEGEYETDDDEDIVVLSSDSGYPLELVGNCVSIAKSSPKSDLSFKVLSEIYTSEEITNILVYGEEDIDYFVRDGHAVAMDTYSYINPSTAFGNMFLSLPHLFQMEEKNKIYRQWIDVMPKTKISGFVFDGRDVIPELEAVTNIMIEFYSCDDNSDVLDMELSELKEKLKKADLDKIQREANLQLQQWCDRQGGDDET